MKRYEVQVNGKVAGYVECAAIVKQEQFWKMQQGQPAETFGAIMRPAMDHVTVKEALPALTPERDGALHLLLLGAWIESQRNQIAARAEADAAEMPLDAAHILRKDEKAPATTGSA